MMNNLLLTFILLNVVNVILQTTKSIATVKCGKWGASLMNASAYFIYSFVLIYMSCDLSVLAKASIVGACNLIGVYIVKTIEEKTKRQKLTKIELTANTALTTQIENDLKGISHSTINLNTNFTLFICYCMDKKQIEKVKIIIEKYQTKYFVAETKSI